MNPGTQPGRPFLTARWRNLILATYVVPEELLRPRLPPGVEPDRRGGNCYASLVAFQFLDTRVFGISWPGYRDFPEWNLRFYVRHGDRRGVCFVREFVPQWLVATVARVLYNEPYRSARMRMEIEEASDTVTANYEVGWGGRTHRLAAVGSVSSVRPTPESAEHFFKEHTWGFGVTRRGRLLQYQVSHPEWDVYPVRSFTVDVNWAVLYGPEWAVMQGKEPESVIFAVGSEIGVYPKRTT